MSDTATKNCRCGLPARNKIVYPSEGMGCEHCDYVCRVPNCPRCKSMNDLGLDIAHYGY